MTRTNQRALANWPNNAVSVLDFGAVGDGVTDDTTAFQNAFNDAAAKVSQGGSASIYIPAGLFLLTSKVVCNVAFVGKEQSISIRGAGMHVSQLLAGENNTDGLLKLTSAGNTETWEVADLGFVSPLVASDGRLNGTALQIESTLKPGDAGFGSMAPPSVILTDINVGGYGTTVTEVNKTAGFWENGIVISNKWYPSLFNCNVHSGAGYLDYDETRAAIKFINVYSPEVNQHYISGEFGYGINHINPDATDIPGTEDFRFNNGFIVGPKYGIYIDHEFQTGTLGEPGGTIIGNHINARLTSIYLSQHRQVIIASNYIYVPKTNTNFGAGLYPAIHFHDAGDITLTDNQLLEPGFYNSESDSSVGIMVSGTSKALVGDNNLFNHGGIGMVFNNTSAASEAPELFNCRTGDGQGSWGLTKTVVAQTAQSLYTCYISNNLNTGLLTNIVRQVGADYKIDESYVIYQSNVSDGWTHVTTHGIVVDPASPDDFTSNSLTKFWIRDNGNAITALELQGLTCKITGGGSFAVGPDVGVTQNVNISGTTFVIKGGIITNVT